MAKKKIEIDVVVDDKGTTKKVALSQKQLEDALDRSGEATGRATKQQRGLIQTANSGGKNFANLASSITNGIVPAYAVLAAQVFAVTAAFQFLQEAANVRNLIVAQEEYGAITGVAYNRITKALQEATDGQLRFQEAAQATAIGTAAGLTGDQLVKLSEAAKNASFALGRDLTDSFNRLIRGVTKAEPELLDELGIILRLDPAIEAYKASIGATGRELNAFERSQAVANFTIEEAERKFGSIGQVIDEEALAVQKFMKAFDDLSNSIKITLVNTLNPILTFLSKNVLALIGLLSIFAAPLVKSVIPSFEEFGKASKKASREAIRGLRDARGEVEKQKKAAENLVLSQEKAFNKASQLAQKGNIGKLGEGKKGGRGAVDFLTGASDSKAAQRNAKRVLDAAQKEFDKYGRIRRGKLQGYNEQELRDLQKSYKLRVRAAGLATKQITSKWGMLAAKQKVFAAQTKLAWKNAFISIGKAGARAPELIDKVFRGASFLGLALLLVDLGKSAIEFFFPMSEAAKKLEEELGKVNERLGELDEHLARVAKHRFKNVLDLNEATVALGKAVQEANIPEFISEIEFLATAQDKSSDEFKKAKISAEGVATSLTQLDSRYKPLLTAIQTGTALTEEQVKAQKALALGSAGAASALETQRQALKDIGLETAKVVSGIPQAPLENLVQLYKTLNTAAATALPEQQNIFLENTKRNSEDLLEVNKALSDVADVTIKQAQDENHENYKGLQFVRELLQKRTDLNNAIQEDAEAFNLIKTLNAQNLAIQGDLETSVATQLGFAQDILTNNKTLSAVNKSSQSFAAREERIRKSILQQENAILQAKINQESASVNLAIAMRQNNNDETAQAVVNAQRQLDIAGDQVAVAQNNRNTQREVNNLKLQEIGIERVLLNIQMKRNDIALRQRRRNIALRDRTVGVASIGRAAGDISRDTRQGRIDDATDRVATDEQAVRNARMAFLKAVRTENEGLKESTFQQLQLARLQVKASKDLLAEELKRVDLIIDAIRLENERQSRLATRISLNPIEREMEEFLLSKGLERKDLTLAQLDALREQITVQQELKIVTQGLANIQTAFQQGIQSGIEGLLSGTVTLKSAFLDLAKAVVASLNQMIAKMIAFKIASTVFSAFAPNTANMDATSEAAALGLDNFSLETGLTRRYGGMSEPRKYAMGGIARGRDAGYGAILHGTEAVIPLGQGAKSIPVEFTGKGSAGGTNNVTVNVAMDSSGNAQTQTSTDTAESNAAFGKAIAAAVQREIHNQKRPGGMLSPYGAGAA